MSSTRSTEIQSCCNKNNNNNNKRPRRSRFGCRNCKIRKLKCDEEKPQCKRCSSFSVLCTFSSSGSVPDLQPMMISISYKVRQNSKEEEEEEKAPGQGVNHHNNIPPAMTRPADDFHTRRYQYELIARCRGFMTRYLGPTSLVVISSEKKQNDSVLVSVNSRLLELAFVHPFLLHASLAAGLAYDRYVSTNTNTNTRRTHTVEECHHRHQSTLLLAKQLEKATLVAKEEVEKEDRDPVWAAAAFLAIATFASPDARVPEEAWPLRSSSSPATDSDFDFDWLRMVNYKIALLDVLDPLGRPDSLFRAMAPTFAHMAPLPTSEGGGVPRDIALVCGLVDSSSTGDAERERASSINHNPYYDAAHALAHMLSLPDSQVTTGRTVPFMQTIRGDFYKLLLGKDPVALLLLYLWYRKAGRCIWWIELRARVECPAIAMYLRLHHGNNRAVLEALLKEEEECG
ncbi:hypothetical protein F5Y17DRAFT_448142 [Xylariaceae sp. FL0594]|nr:hypothetical protein F5Y17DRAFT_448142 [Xylariaceae sp. FL0594]